MGKPTTKQIFDVLRQYTPCTWEVHWEDETKFAAAILEFPGVVYVAPTVEMALDRLGDLAVAWVEDQLEKGEDIPAPDESLKTIIIRTVRKK